MDQIHIPEPLAAKFLAGCAEANIDAEQAITQWMDEYLQEIEALKIAKARAENPEGFVSLEQIAQTNGLEL